MRALIRRCAAYALAGAALLAGVHAGVAAPAYRALPRKSVRHENSQFWVWFGPANWTSVDGAQGITITSNNGRRVIDYGFSSVFCATGQTVEQSVANYYAQQRAALRANVRAAWKSSTFRAGQIRQMPAAGYGPLYFRQTYEASGSFRGVRYRSEIQMDYSLASGPQFCFARNESRTAPAQGFATAIRELRSVQGSMAYFGPGVPGGDGLTDPDL